LYIITAIGSSWFYAFDMYTGQQRWAVDVGIGGLQLVGWTPDDKMLAWDSATLTITCFQGTSSGLTKLWVSTEQPGMYPWAAMEYNVRFLDNEYVYYIGYDGSVRAFDLDSGECKWNTIIANNTETPMGTYATGSVAIADGKVYVGVREHTETQPLMRGSVLCCLDRATGEILWRVSGFMATGPIAGGYFWAADEYTGYTYCFGKGATESAVTASPKAQVLGNRIVIEGSVLDMSPASAGTPAISDEDMDAWMNYLHMQASEPMTSPNYDSWGTPVNVKGVDVSLDAIDPNGNFVHLGTATGTASGTYGLAFKPEVPGLYRIIATFAGSESYWSSFAETYVNVEEAPTVTPPAEQVPTDLTMVYYAVIGGVIAIIVAIAIAALLILRRK
jgi:hypothetical protein